MVPHSRHPQSTNERGRSEPLVQADIVKLFVYGVKSTHRSSVTPGESGLTGRLYLALTLDRPPVGQMYRAYPYPGQASRTGSPSEGGHGLSDF